MTAFSPASRGRLTQHDLGRFATGTLFDRLGRTLCEAGCLPRKELYESWELARRTRRVIRGGRIVDLAGGHGLLAHVMLLLDNTSSSALVVDTHIPSSAQQVSDVLVREWPRLAGCVTYVSGPIDSVALTKDDVVVSCHACGALTDHILTRAVEAGARLSVMPCCHDADACDAGPLGGWLESSLAIDVMRAIRLESAGYQVWTQAIPEAITPKNRVLIGVPK